MRKKLFALAALSLLTSFFSLFTSAEAQVVWHSIDDASEAKIGEKVFFVDFYTSWCGYCKKMDRETFSDPTVITLLNKYFYPVKFDAEGNKTVTWAGKTYHPTKGAGRYRTHEFARGISGFPTFVLYWADGTPLQAIPGFYPAKDFIVILWYFASGDYNRYPYEHYRQIFDKEIRSTMEKAINQ